jgi:hypothetical protein
MRSVGFHRANNRVEHAHVVRSTRKGDAPLLAAHAERWAAAIQPMSIKKL